jgi:hypothetical protein
MRYRNYNGWNDKIKTILAFLDWGGITRGGLSPFDKIKR